MNDELLHDLPQLRAQQREAVHREITNERVRGLPHRRLWVLKANRQQVKQVRVGSVDVRLQRHAQALCQAREEIESYNKEGLVRLIQVRVLLVSLVVEQRAVDERHAPLEDGRDVR